MKKYLSIILSAVIVFSTLLVLTALPTTAEPPVNLIVNGSAEGVYVSDGNGGQVLKQTYNADDVASSAYLGEKMAGNVYGFRNCSSVYANISHRPVRTISTAPAGYFSNFTGSNVLGINTNQQLYQDIEIEKNKAYTVSAKITSYPNTTPVSSDRFFDIFIDNKAGTIDEQYSLPSGKDWNLATGHSEVMAGIKQRFNNPTVVAAGSEYYGTGDFTEYSFTFKARDLIEEYNLSPNQNGKYDVRLVIHNRIQYILLAEDISVVEADMGQFLSVEAGKGGTVKGEVKTDGSKTNVTAVPYYGNRFLGWYDEDDALVSTDANFNAVLTKTIIARFTQENLITDGNFESGDGKTATEYNNYPHYSEAAVGTAVVGDTCVSGSGVEYGDKALYLTPNSSADNGKIKGLLNIPVSLSKGKTYIWRFSYAFPNVAYDASKHYIHFSVDKEENGKIGWSGTVDYSYHIQRSSLPSIDTNNYTWSKNIPVTSDAAVRSYNLSAADEWIHIYVIFTADADETYRLALGTAQGCTDTFVIDNMSLTETGNTDTATSVTIEGEGSVVSGQGFVSAYRATENVKNSQTTYDTLETAPYHSRMTDTLYAKAARGYRFDGWYKNGEKVSSDPALAVFTVGESYVAKFAVDNNQYSVNAVVEDKNGVKGGYITDNLTGEEYFSGETVTFTAHAYKGNRFLGWYDGQTLLSSALEYEYVIDKSVTLTAKFENNNLFADAGYENSAPAQNNWGADKEWFTDSASTTDEAVVVTTDSFDGEKSLFINAPNKNIISKTFSVDANTDYHFAFDWRSVVAKTDKNDAALASVEVVNAADGSRLFYSGATEAIGSEGWQKFYCNFNTASATTVKVILKYTAAAQSLFLDNLTLFDTSLCDFVITAEVETSDGIYPGFITSERVVTAQKGEGVTVSVVGYQKNVFLGWYSEKQCVSTDESYTFAADSFINLVAKFEVENVFPDAGFENTPAGVQLDKIDGAYFVNNVSWGSITANESAARSGKYGVEAIHRNNEFNTIIDGLKPNTDYELTFWWKMRVASNTTTLDHVQVNGVQSGKLLSTTAGAVSSDEWQQAKLVFNTAQNTSVKIDYKYTSGSTGIFLDDFCLNETNNIKVLAGEGGSVSSTHEGSVELGTVVTVTATETTGRFLGWYDYQNPQIVLSTNKTYTFTVTGSKTIIAYFEGEGIPPVNYLVDGDLEQGLFKGVVFSHPWGSVDACTYNIVGSGKNGITPYSGSKMLEINNRGNYVILRMPNLKPSTDYTLSFYWNAEESGGLATTSIWPYLHEMVRLDENRYSADSPGGYTKLMYYDSSNHDVIKMSTAHILGRQLKSDGWEKVQISFNSDATNENILHFTTYGAHKTIYLDNIVLAEGNSGYSEELVNGDFASPNAENGWLGEFVTEQGYGASSGEMQQNLILETADAYTLRFRAKSLGNAAELIYGFTKAGQTTLTGKTALTQVSYDTVTLTGEWKDYELTFSTANYQQYSLFFRSVNGERFAIDDVTISDAESIAPVQTITFENDEKLSSFSGNVAFANKIMNNKDWYEYSTAENHTAGGSQSLLMKYKSDFADHSFIQEINTLSFASGRTYHVSFWAKAASAGTKFRAYAQVHADGWIVTDLYNSVETLDGTEWTKFDYYFTVPFIENWGGPTAFIMVDGVEDGTTSDIYFDDFVIEESERNAIKTAQNLYTQNLSQNYFYPNYHFEDASDPYFGQYTVSGSDAFYGQKYLTVKAGDKIVVPVKTRQDWALSLYAEYTLSAAVRGDSNAKGYLGVSYTPDGNTLIKDKAGNEVTIPVNTGGNWKHSGISFVDNSFTTVYFVIECTSGSFSVDYISMFNNLRGYKENTDDNQDYTFDADNADNYVDMSIVRKENFLSGVINGLPDGSTVILDGKQSYTADVSSLGEYEIRNIADGTYNLLIKASDAAYATMWGDITFENGVGSGLGLERINANVIKITGQGVASGVVKLRNDDTGYGYLSLTDENGYFTAYITDSAWSVVGTTTETEILTKYSLKFADFGGVVTTEIVIPAAKTPLAPTIVLMVTLALCVGTLWVTRKKGECR